ncbi:hypothetical protein BDW22DRAFT_851743 [Trametopsis cervina]|nr:hypothetical protein BDW22DRAFT_851743 [Trametopsis cervina]
MHIATPDIPAKIPCAAPSSVCLRSVLGSEYERNLGKSIQQTTTSVHSRPFVRAQSPWCGVHLPSRCCAARGDDTPRRLLSKQHKARRQRADSTLRVPRMYLGFHGHTNASYEAFRLAKSYVLAASPSVVAGTVPSTSFEHEHTLTLVIHCRMGHQRANQLSAARALH